MNTMEQPRRIVGELLSPSLRNNTEPPRRIVGEQSHRVREHVVYSEKEVVREVEVDTYVPRIVESQVRHAAIVERAHAVPEPYDLTLKKEVLHVDRQVKERTYDKPEYNIIYRDVEVPLNINRQCIEEVTKEFNVPLKKEVPKFVEKYVDTHVRVKQEYGREKSVERQLVTKRDVVKEVPVPEAHYFQIEVEGPRKEEQIPKDVEVVEVRNNYVTETVERQIEEEYCEEVPETKYVDLVHETAKEIIQEVFKTVKVKKPVEKHVVETVPRICYEEELVEVPEIEIVERIKRVPKYIVKYVDKPISVSTPTYKEVVTDIPKVLVQETRYERVERRTVNRNEIREVPEYDDVKVPLKQFALQVNENKEEVEVKLKEEKAVEINMVQTVDIKVQKAVEQKVSKTKTLPKVEVNVVQKNVEVPVTLTTEREQPDVKMFPIECTREELVAEPVDVKKEVPKIINNFQEKIVQVEPRGERLITSSPAIRIVSEDAIRTASPAIRIVSEDPIRTASPAIRILPEDAIRTASPPIRIITDDSARARTRNTEENVSPNRRVIPDTEVKELVPRVLDGDSRVGTSPLMRIIQDDSARAPRVLNGDSRAMRIVQDDPTRTPVTRIMRS